MCFGSLKQLLSLTLFITLFSQLYGVSLYNSVLCQSYILLCVRLHWRINVFIVGDSRLSDVRFHGRQCSPTCPLLSLVVDRWQLTVCWTMLLKRIQMRLYVLRCQLTGDYSDQSSESEWVTSFISRPTLFCPDPNRRGHWVMILSDACLSVAYIGPKSRTERPRKTKVGTAVAHITRDSDTTFKVKGQGHRPLEWPLTPDFKVSHMRSIERWHFQWRWQTTNPVFKVTAFFKVEYQKKNGTS